MTRAVPLALAILLMAPDGAASQAGECRVVGDRWAQIEENGTTILISEDPLVATCPDGTVLQANSGRLNRSINELYLAGSVFFQDSTRTLTADEATYNTATEQLTATGNVEFVNRIEGSTLSGPNLEYFRESEVRPESAVFASGRPTLTLRREGEPDAEPLQLVADQVTILGEDDLSAYGSVVITRSDLEAVAVEASYNSTTEDLELRQDARITQDDFELGGEVIQAQITEGSLEHVHARTDARLVGEDLLVTSPDLQLFFEADSLRRVTARVPEEVENTQATATSSRFAIVADSLDATFIDQLLREVHAIGNARGETIDSTTVAGSVLTGVGVAPDSVEAVLDPAVEVPGEAVAEPPESAPAGEGAVQDASVETVVAQEPPPPDSPPDSAALEAPGEPADPTLAGVAADSLADGTESAELAQGTPLRPEEIVGRDWIRGDTIVAYFEPVSPDSVSEETRLGAADSIGVAEAPPAVEPMIVEPCDGPDCPPQAEEAEPRREVELRRLVAIGEAQSLYRIAAEGDPTGECRNLNFLVGERIELDVNDGELEVAHVTGLKQGVYLEWTACLAGSEPGAVAPLPADGAADEPENGLPEDALPENILPEDALPEEAPAPAAPVPDAPSTLEEP